MIIVTGAAGFIGSCIVARLNERGRDDLVLVDHLDDPLKERNLHGKKYLRYSDKLEFIESIRKDKLNNPVECVIHMGACSSTTLQDADYFEKNNFEYTKDLALWCLAHGVRYIYASSAATYGDGSGGYRDDVATTRRCRPLNLYGFSKQKFDLWALDQSVRDRMVGLKFFNVFGPNEYHKADMRSVVSKAYDRVVSEGKMALFKSGRPEYGHGEQKRDFIYAKDAVEIVLFFMDHPHIRGLFNAGTGQARSWNDLAKALFSAVGKKAVIEYIDMPPVLEKRYQYFTQADLTNLRNAGFTKQFFSLEDAVKDYVKYLKDHRCW